MRITGEGACVFSPQSATGIIPKFIFRKPGPDCRFFCVPIKYDCSLALISTDIPMQQPSVYYAQAQPIVMPISPTPMVQGMSPDFGRGQVFPQVIILFFFTIKYSYLSSEILK